MAAGGGAAARAAVPGLEALYRHLPSAVYKFNVRPESRGGDRESA